MLFRQTVLIQTIQFNISMQVFLFNPYLTYQVLPFRARVDLEAMAMKGFSHSPKLQHHWNLTIKLFSFIYGPTLAGSYPSSEVQSV